MKFRDMIENQECVNPEPPPFEGEWGDNVIAEGEEDVIFSKTVNGKEIKIHVHEGEFVVKIDGEEYCKK
jgi:hypothetical protein